MCLFQSVVRSLWHPKLNQIMVGTGNGLAKVYYDPVKSHRYVWLLSLGQCYFLFMDNSFHERNKTNLSYLPVFTLKPSTCHRAEISKNAYKHQHCIQVQFIFVNLSRHHKHTVSIKTNTLSESVFVVLSVTHCCAAALTIRNIRLPNPLKKALCRNVSALSVSVM